MKSPLLLSSHIYFKLMWPERGKHKRKKKPGELPLTIAPVGLPATPTRSPRVQCPLLDLEGGQQGKERSLPSEAKV